MENLNPKPENTLQAEASEGKVGSITAVVSRLLRWGRIAPSGLARVEYISDTSQLAAIQRLCNGFQQAGIPFVEIALPARKPAVEQVQFLREQLAQIESGVVSITGFAHAFSEDTLLLESLRVLNFNRENLADFPLRQIWWMPRDFTQTFRQSIPDLHSWFIIKLRLDEITTPLHLNPQNIKSSSPFMMGHEEGANTSNFYAARYRVAIQRRGKPETLWQIWRNAVTPLLNVGRTNDAVHLQEALIQEALDNGIDMRNHLISESINAALLNDIGEIYYQEGQYTEAEPLYKRALKMSSTLQAAHPYLFTSLTNMAELYSRQGRYVEAKPLLLRALEVSQIAFPKGHPNIAGSLENMAAWFLDQEDYAAAEPLLKEALEMNRAALPKDHPNIGVSLTYLASLYDNQGRYIEAEPLYREALEICRVALPEGHPEIANSLINLAGLYTSQKRYAEAEPLYKEASAIHRATLPAEHADLAASLKGLAEWYDSQNRYSEAEALYKEALVISRSRLPEGHREIAAILNNLALLYDNFDRVGEAIPLMKEALSILATDPGLDHPDTKAVAANYAALLAQSSDSERRKVSPTNS